MVKRYFKQANETKKKVVMPILIPNQVDFKSKLIKRGIEEHYKLIKGKTCQEDTAILNIYVPNTRALNILKETLIQLKSHTDCYTMLVGDFNTPLLQIDRSSRQKLHTNSEANSMGIFNQPRMLPIFSTN